MFKESFLLLLATLIVAPLHLAEAQQPKIPRIGFVDASGDPSSPSLFVQGFRQGLRELGYVEGKNIVIEYRYGQGKVDQLPSLVNELVQLKPDILVVGALPAFRAAKEATKSIPIVMVASVDPVATGIVDSLARPGQP